MKILIDIEANGLVNPTEIWLIVCKDIDTGAFHIFRNVTTNEIEKERFLEFAKQIDLWIGHNFLSYDYPVLHSLLKFYVEDVASHSCDTLILSKLIDYSRGGHSIEHYGEEFGIKKGTFSSWNDPELRDPSSELYKELETYCIRDVDITHKIYLKYLKYLTNPLHTTSINLEHKFQLIVNTLGIHGFAFNSKKAIVLLNKVKEELDVLDKAILKEFPPKQVLVREFTPTLTKHGTISRTSVPRSLHSTIADYEAGVTYPLTKMVEFNPSSHKQIIEVLASSGWSPIDKTKTHTETERALNRLRYSRKRENELDITSLCDKLKTLEKTGYKINENNLATLPDNSPSPARTLAQRILLESRRRTLTEWINLVQEDGRIHGKFYGIGAWTHRMAHQHPNTANIPTDAKLYGNEMRALWQAPRNRLLVGVDAEGIQLRIFAHYIDDKEFTNALVNGKKSNKSDPHSLNQRILGAKSRNIAKRFIFAYLLGAGLGKLAEILEISEDEARRALDRLVERYEGLARLKKSVIPIDARRGWFIGLDGRRVRIPGETAGERKHLCMSGYLQNGEAIIIKKAAVKFVPKLKEFKSFLVDIVHDEYQTETPNNMEIALKIAKLEADTFREVGEELNLKCPLAGSYWNEDRKDYTIGTNWSVTH